MVRPDPEKQPRQRAGEDRRPHEQAELGVIQTQFGFDFDADNGKYRPDGEADRKGKCAEAERPVLIRRNGNLNGRHSMAPIEFSRDAIG